MRGLIQSMKYAIGATFVSLACHAIAIAQGQGYPSKPVRIITGNTANLSDIVTRQIAVQLNERWRQPVIVENRPGPAQTISTAAAAKAAPDGYTLVMADRSGIAVAPSFFRNLPYDPMKDLAPITLVAKTPLVMVAHASVTASTLREFIAQVKQLPQGLNYASAGTGTAGNIDVELMKQLTGANLVAVHYKGGGAAMLAVLGGEVQFGLFPPLLAIQHLKTGKVKALAVTSQNRFAGTPDVPSVAEAGFPEFGAEYWIGMLAPARTPESIIGKLNSDIVDILRTPSMQTTLTAQAAILAPSSPREFAAFIESESRKWSKVITAAGIKPE
jgi:tripartite-type tricarboxylate transporter receptor subunit TctC